MQQVKKFLIKFYRFGANVSRNRGLRGIPIFLRLDRWIRKHLRLKETMIDGHRLFLDDRDSLSLSIESNHEQFENEILDIVAASSRIIVDIGANIGFNTVRFSRAVGPSGKVYAFEPEQSNIQLLQKNLTINRYTNVLIIPKAVSDKKGFSNLFLSEENRGDHQLYKTTESRSGQRVEVTTIDEEIPNFSADLIKIDIQGFEYWALRGSKKLITRSPSVIVFSEFWPEGLKNAGSSSFQYLSILKELGFNNIYEIDARARGLRHVDHQYWNEKNFRGSGHTNILALKENLPTSLKHFELQ
jgi:FkbM family methyltransferase